MENQTEISQLGEFGLIDRITSGLENVNESTVKGVGDDCAVLDYPGSRVLVSTDLLVEGVHFDLTYVPLKHLGYKAAVVNFSDIYAMNGTPRQITVGLAVSSRFTVEHIEALYSGIRLACDIYGVD
ncbi:MAG: thiamine-phosphate kinase, partial [Paramuribaculum sp.]|nr:thiamine-phosphate kinase [Paramuribaculum sp.]